MRVRDIQERSAPHRGITLRSILLGALTVAFLCIYTNYSEFKAHSAALVMSNLPMAAFLPFILWIFLNTLLRTFAPAFALSGTELLVILGMSWTAGNIPAIGWTGYWMGIVTAPYYYAAPENRWQELFFDYLPRWLLTDPKSSAIPWFYNGLPEGADIPWGAWLSPLFWWFTASMAIVVIGVSLAVIFSRQWIDHEKLVFPLAQIPMDLTEDFDGRSRVPGFLKSKLFWIGFAWPMFVICWNIVGYFHPNFPRIEIFDSYMKRKVYFSRYAPPIPFRVLPSVIGFTYLCNLDILFSFWFFYLLSVIQMGVMNRTGFTVGLSNQTASPHEIVNLESHGALTFLVFWSVWISRKHLREVLQKAWNGEQNPDNPVSYRIAVIGLILGVLYLLGFLCQAGIHILYAAPLVLLIFIGYFGVTKYLGRRY